MQVGPQLSPASLSIRDRAITRRPILRPRSIPKRSSNRVKLFTPKRSSNRGRRSIRRRRLPLPRTHSRWKSPRRRPTPRPNRKAAMGARYSISKIRASSSRPKSRRLSRRSIRKTKALEIRSRRSISNNKLTRSRRSISNNRQTRSRRSISNNRQTRSQCSINNNKRAPRPCFTNSSLPWSTRKLRRNPQHQSAPAQPQHSQGAPAATRTPHLLKAAEATVVVGIKAPTAMAVEIRKAIKSAFTNREWEGAHWK